MTKPPAVPNLVEVPAEDSLDRPDPAEQRWHGADLGGVAGPPLEAGPQIGISAVELDRAAAHVDAIMLAALLALAAPSEPAAHLRALAMLRAALAGSQDLAVASNRHRQPRVQVEVRPTPPPVPQIGMDALHAAALAAIQEED